MSTLAAAPLVNSTLDLEPFEHGGEARRILEDRAALSRNSSATFTSGLAPTPP
jgi:hypothetical protein